MNCLTQSFAIVLLLFPIKQYHCFDKESLVFDTVLSDPLDSHANSKAIDLESNLDTTVPVLLRNKAKSRRRRYVAFPEGSSFSASHTDFYRKL